VITATETRTAPTVGVHPRVPFLTYVGWEAINWHTLEPFRRSAKHGHHAMLIPDDATDTQVFGAAFHAAVLEPESFERDYATMPKFEGHPNSTACKQAKAQWIDANRTKVAITASERIELIEMAKSVRAHPVASAMLASKGRNELSIVWRDGTTGALCKGRVDRVCRVKVGIINPAAANAEDDALCLIDFKTTRAVDPLDFDREVAKYAYHAQLAMYVDGMNAISPAPLHPYIVAIENCPPFDVVVRSLDEHAIGHGRRLYRRLLKTYLVGERTKRWPGICDSVIPVVLPKWAEEPGLEDAE
jgi:hypothetical protein